MNSARTDRKQDSRPRSPSPKLRSSAAERNFPNPHNNLAPPKPFRLHPRVYPPGVASRSNRAPHRFFDILKSRAVKNVAHVSIIPSRQTPTPDLRPHSPCPAQVPNRVPPAEKKCFGTFEPRKLLKTKDQPLAGPCKNLPKHDKTRSFSCIFQAKISIFRPRPRS